MATLYTTGLGAMDLPVEVHIGGRAAEVISTRESATRAGMVEVRVPEAPARESRLVSRPLARCLGI